MAEEKTTVDQETELNEDTVLDEQTEQPTPEETTGEPEPTDEEVSAEGDEPEADVDAQETDAAQASKSEKKNLFKKKEKKKDKRDERIEELTDQVKRQMAEFENFRKRTDKEKTQMYEVGAKSIIEKILPVVDNFERGLAAVPEEQKNDAFVEGMDKIYKQMMTVFDELDVKPIEAVGKEFDPEYHNAVMQVESEEYESGVVAQELQKGYMYRDSVVRHSMVAVVQ
ncbi:MAG: nucleotide exchange factor GrpE [Lachnospiraceae bacterium]|nr:nucleotide exchange factor GrpE [Lachnospiraceae bacterium]MDD7176372.1 nucleotide exchange factor GrpE [bacterium]MDY5517460.1 nucleotide exchange factor GrpE [Lachnospiraceae bacterium]